MSAVVTMSRNNKVVIILTQIILANLVTCEYIVKKECASGKQRFYGRKIEDFELIHSNSKYGVAVPYFRDSQYQSGKDYCESFGMQLADIKTLEDLKSIDRYMDRRYPNCSNYNKIFLTGANRRSGENLWLDQDGNVTSFSSFYSFEPYHAKIESPYDRDYAVLLCKKKEEMFQGPSIQYFQRDSFNPGIYTMGVICQFKPDTPCFQNSDETKINMKLKDEMEHVGDSRNRKYYIGTGQKTFKDAFQQCNNEGLKMVDLEFPDTEEAYEMYSIMSRWIRKKDIFAESTSFFLSGSFEKAFQCDGTFFEWEWADNLRDNSFKTFGSGSPPRLGKCMSIGALYPKEKKFHLSPADCHTVHWVMCYKNYLFAVQQKTEPDQNPLASLPSNIPSSKGPTKGRGFGRIHPEQKRVNFKKPLKENKSILPNLKEEKEIPVQNNSVEYNIKHSQYYYALPKLKQQKRPRFQKIFKMWRGDKY